MKVRQMHTASALLCLSLAAIDSGPAFGAEYPVKPVRLIVPFAPGGSTDVLARALAEKLSQAFAKPIVVDNRGGGGGVVGTESALRATPDGYTLIFVSGSYGTNAALRSLNYDPVKDITPISLACETGYLVAVYPGLKISSPQELIDYARAKPSAVNYGSAGQGSLAHLATALFATQAGIKLTHIPYKGTGPAILDLIGGRVQVVFGGTPGLITHHKANRVRAIAITTAKRAGVLPDIPALSESLPGYEAALWFGFWGPKGLSESVVKRWNVEIDRAIHSADVKAKLATQAVEPVGGAPSVFKETLQSDIQKWKKLVKSADIML